MHELSIVLGIVDLAEEKLRSNGGREIHEIELEIGELAGVAWDALEYAWNEGVRGSALERANRIIHKIPGYGACMDCDHEFELGRIGDPCPSCGSYLIDIRKGRELRVLALLID